MAVVTDVNATPSDQYQDLLVTITELQTDLQKTVAFATELKQENDDLRQTRDDLKATLVRTRERNKESQTSVLKQLEHASKREKALDEAKSKWKLELATREREIEALQDKLAPQDQRGIRCEIEEELRQLYDSKVLKLQQEVEKWRTDFLRARREHEACRAQHEEFVVVAEKDIASAHNARKTEVSALEELLAKHFESEGEAQMQRAQDETRQLQQQIVELQAVEEELRREATDLREARDKEEMAKQKLISSHQTELAKVLSLHASTDADKQIAIQRICCLEKEVESLSTAKKEGKEALEAAKNDIIRLEEALESKEKEAQCDRERMVAESEVSQNLLSSELDEMKKRAATLEAKLDAERCSQSDAYPNATFKSLSANAEDLLRLKDLNTRLENRVMQLEGEKSYLESEKMKLIHACEACRFDCDLAKREKEAMAKEVVSAQKKSERLQTELETCKKSLGEAEAGFRSLSVKVDQTNEQNMDIESQNELLKSRLDRAESDLAKVKKELKEQLTTLKNAMLKERKKANHSLRAEKQRSEAYKEKALEAHQKTLKAKKVLSCIAMNTATGEQDLAFAKSV